MSNPVSSRPAPFQRVEGTAEETTGARGPIISRPPPPQPGEGTAEGATYAHRLLDATRRFAELPALRFKQGDRWEQLSYAELERRVLACAAQLRARGVVSGDRVAIWLETSWPWIVVDFAAQLLGAVTTTIYHALVPKQAAEILRDAKPRVLLANAARLSALAALGRLPKAETVVISVDGGSTGQPFDQVLAEGQRSLDADPALAEALRTPSVGPDDLSVLIYTSGTTGEPKGVMLTHRNVLANADGAIQCFGRREGKHTLLLHLPLAHVMARNTAVPFILLRGGVLALAEPEREKIAANLVETSPTCFITVPFLLDKFMERVLANLEQKGAVMRALASRALRVCRERRLAALGSSGKPQPAKLGFIGDLLDRIVLEKIRARLGGQLEWIVIGGSSSNRRSVEFFWGLGIPIFEGYGASEMTNTISVCVADAVKLGTVGRGHPGGEHTIAADGEILARGPTVMKGYWRRPEATAEVIDQEGWYHTGDLGSLDADGYLTIIDRKRDLIVLSTGKNVAPQAVENVLGRTPLLLNSCAIGHRQRYMAALLVPDLAAIQQRLKLAAPPALDDARVADLLRQELRPLLADLSDFERIKRFVLVEQPFTVENELLTPTLKLRRQQIVARYASEVEDLYSATPRRAVAL